MKIQFLQTFSKLKKLLIINCAFLIISSPSSAQIQNFADSLINDSVVSTGHIGISVYDPIANSYLYNYDAAKYFVPASNAKLFTLYAGMKYLGDSLVGLRYKIIEPIKPSTLKYDSFEFRIIPTGDPTFMHPDFTNQPVKNFIENLPYNRLIIHKSNWKATARSEYWSWGDFAESYCPERSAMPVHGNLLTFIWQDSINKDRIIANRQVDVHLRWKTSADFKLNPYWFYGYGLDRNYFDDFYRDRYNLLIDTGRYFTLKKAPADDAIWVIPSKEKVKQVDIPINTEGDRIISILNQQFKNKHFDQVGYKVLLKDGTFESQRQEFQYQESFKDSNLSVIHSQPSDSLFKLMMHRSDNFFAEQTLLMVSNEHLGYMNDEDIIDTLLKSDLKDIPQKPRWVDGSGLSRYNLFTPQSFIYILNKMKNEFGWERLKVILPTGGEGTLKNYYHSDSSFIYAKTGSMSNNNSLSGYLITKKNKLLIFSILVNNFQGDATHVKRAIEQFLENIRDRY
ncbi:D-alanyl-D-alanine carboxypeptidase [Ferruginibacter albus]|uniref:D-alanyl-D-alanine carboxypeptidase n=1 Tax=Ferruginibacter albus TaxID=2875540 RepID=UPI001CC82777|nr:D-alanyl-D-alanine carboxypeptidase [Ferruginibacter albus]UAY51892.1 D-alanyl-D-alanine carboxypeptidase [Ferruginibacter albus]